MCHFMVPDTVCGDRLVPLEAGTNEVTWVVMIGHHEELGLDFLFLFIIVLILVALYYNGH